MRRVITFIGLELYAVLLALYQGLGSVRTDEAKYLLDIPYPHPPLMRSIMHVTETIAAQELLWRIVLASLMVHAVWLIARLAKHMTPEERLTLCGLWIFSASVVFQAGTIMMAPITALQGGLFVWILLRDPRRSNAGGVALLWLASLFTAYQAVLYAPLVLAIFIKQRVQYITTILALGIPVLLLAMYIAANPLAAASFVSAGNQNVSVPPFDVVQMVLGSWLWSGSIVLSIAGFVGMIRARHLALLGSTALVFAFLATSFRSYYAVLFLPLLVGGVLVHPRVLKRSAALLAMQIVAIVWIFAHTTLSFYPSPARTVMHNINQLPMYGAVLINGSFGHEWQYESTAPVYRYAPSLLSKAKAVVCIDPCRDIRQYGFYSVDNTAMEVWIRKKAPTRQ